MVEEDAGLLQVCLKTFGAAPLSQTGFLRVKTLPGSAEGIICMQMSEICSTGWNKQNYFQSILRKWL